MAGDKIESSSVNENANKHLHPTYTVTNIQVKVRTLDGNKVTYSTWVKLFEIQAKAFKVMDHIDGTEAPATTDVNFADWATLDSLVLQWIYSTLSDELLACVIPTCNTTLEAWTKVKGIFMNNKNVRATTLQYEFNNLVLSSCASMDAYCQKLQDLANQLGDVDHPISKYARVLQLVRGLSKEYEVVGAMINQQSPTWETTRDMLHLENTTTTSLVKIIICSSSCSD